MTQEEWTETVRNIIEDSESVELTYSGTIHSDSSVSVTSKKFSTEYILGMLPDELREKMTVYLDTTKSSEGDNKYYYVLRKRNIPFTTEFVGGDIVEYILQEKRIEPLEHVEEYEVTDHGVILYTNELREPKIFKSMITTSFRLYKTYIPVNKEYNYAFIYRQQREDTNEAVQKMKNVLSRYRVRQIEWNTTLDCDVCKSHNSVEMKPTDRENSEKYTTTFHCTDCDTRLGSERRLNEEINGNQSGKAIENKLKQKYKTAVGRPNNAIKTESS